MEELVMYSFYYKHNMQYLEIPRQVTVEDLGAIL